MRKAGNAVSNVIVQPWRMVDAVLTQTAALALQAPELAYQLAIIQKLIAFELTVGISER